MDRRGIILALLAVVASICLSEGRQISKRRMLEKRLQKRGVATTPETYIDLCQVEDVETFQCLDGDCVRADYQCDEEEDCYDGSDEANCPETIDLCKVEDVYTFQCLDGDCVRADYKCDEEEDCYDGSDEANCGDNMYSDLCKLNIPTFKCNSGECIVESFYCDGGEPDCADNSDEDNCQDHECNSRSELDCGDGTCRPLSYRCDGWTNCDDKSDEQGCPSNSDFKCNDGNVLKYGLAQRCDGSGDCKDGSDELNCDGYQCSSVVQLTCNDGSCKPLYFQCDGTVDCAGGEDEDDC